jgi:hypothetical protein
LRQYLDFESSFKPEELKAMTVAFERVILMLDLKSRPDLTLPVIGATIIRFAKQGEFDPAVLCERTVTALKGGAALAPTKTAHPRSPETASDAEAG